MDRYRKVIYIYRREGRLPRWLHSFRKLTAPLICGRLITRLQDVRAKYRPVSELGRGAYGLVLCCLEKATGQHVACKAVDVIALLQTRDGPTATVPTESCHCGLEASNRWTAQVWKRDENRTQTNPASSAQQAASPRRKIRSSFIPDGWKGKSSAEGRTSLTLWVSRTAELFPAYGATRASLSPIALRMLATATRWV